MSLRRIKALPDYIVPALSSSFVPLDSEESGTGKKKYSDFYSVDNFTTLTSDLIGAEFINKSNAGEVLSTVAQPYQGVWFNNNPGVIGGFTVDLSDFSIFVNVHGTPAGNLLTFSTINGTKHVNMSSFTAGAKWIGVTYVQSTDTLTYYSDGVATGYYHPSMTGAVAFTNFANQITNGYIRRCYAWNSVISAQQIAELVSLGINNVDVFSIGSRPVARWEPEHVSIVNNVAHWHDSSGNSHDAVVFGVLVDPAPWLASGDIESLVLSTSDALSTAYEALNGLTGKSDIGHTHAMSAVVGLEKALYRNSGGVYVDNAGGQSSPSVGSYNWSLDWTIQETVTVPAGYVDGPFVHPTSGGISIGINAGYLSMIKCGVAWGNTVTAASNVPRDKPINLIMRHTGNNVSVFINGTLVSTVGIGLLGLGTAPVFGLGYTSCAVHNYRMFNKFVTDDELYMLSQNVVPENMLVWSNVVARYEHNNVTKTATWVDTGPNCYDLKTTTTGVIPLSPIDVYTRLISGTTANTTLPGWVNGSTYTGVALNTSGVDATIEAAVRAGDVLYVSSPSADLPQGFQFVNARALVDGVITLTMTNNTYNDESSGTLPVTIAHVIK